MSKTNCKYKTVDREWQASVLEILWDGDGTEHETRIEFFN